MRRVFAGLIILVAVSAVAVVGCSAGVVPGTEGCVWRSVDGREYIDANEAVLRSIPLSARLRQAHATTWNHGIPASNKCLPFENSPPYSAFITTYVFVRQQGEPPLGFDRTILGPEWVLHGGGLGGDWVYRKGTAQLVITNYEEGVLLKADHRAYAS